MTDTFTKLVQALDEHQATYSRLDAYYNGTQPLAFLSPDAKDALGDRLSRMVSNLPRLAVGALTERLRVTGFTGPDVWPDWIANDLDQTSTVAHREALTLGASFAIVWADRAGAPSVSIESARQVSVLRDPGTRTITAAVKRWETDKTTEAVQYGPDQILRYRADSTGATTAGYRLIETIPNPLGVVPVVELRNADRVLSCGVSEITDLIPLVDALNKTLADMMVGSEYFARPRRWATGIEADERDVLNADGNPTGETEAVNPYPEGTRMMVHESEDAKFGQLPPGDPSGYTAAVNVLLSQIMAVSALPAHYLGVLSNQPASADALRAAEASLAARAEARQATFGRAWEQVARLMQAVRTGADPSRVQVRVQWADPTTRSVAQEADAVVKLFSAGLLPATYALQRLGYTDDQIAQVRQARRAESLDQLATTLPELIGGGNG